MAQASQTRHRSVLPTSETWSELKRAWKSYKIAKIKADKAKMTESAHKIQELQKIMGAKQSRFPELSK